MHKDIRELYFKTKTVFKCMCVEVGINNRNYTFHINSKSTQQIVPNGISWRRRTRRGKEEKEQSEEAEGFIGKLISPAFGSGSSHVRPSPTTVTHTHYVSYLFPWERPYQYILRYPIPGFKTRSNSSEWNATEFGNIYSRVRGPQESKPPQMLEAALETGKRSEVDLFLKRPPVPLWIRAGVLICKAWRMQRVPDTCTALIFVNKQLQGIKQ